MMGGNLTHNFVTGCCKIRKVQVWFGERDLQCVGATLWCSGFAQQSLPCIQAVGISSSPEAGLRSDTDVDDLVKEMRSEE